MKLELITVLVNATEISRSEADELGEMVTALGGKIRFVVVQKSQSASIELTPEQYDSFKTYWDTKEKK